MAFDAFMYFPTKGDANCPVGETLDTTFGAADKKAFEIKSFKIEVKNPTSMGSAGGGAGTGKCQLEPFEIGKVTDNCSPQLFATCAQGTHYTNATIAVRKAGGAAGSTAGAQSRSGYVYLQYDFNCVFVNSVSWNGSSGDDLPEETVQFAYGSVTITYTPQKSGGGAGTPNIQIWNQVTNNNTAAVPSPS